MVKEGRNRREDGRKRRREEGEWGGGRSEWRVTDEEGEYGVGEEEGRGGVEVVKEESKRMMRRWNEDERSRGI